MSCFDIYFSSLHICSLDKSSADINTDILKMNSGGGSNYPGGGNSGGDQGGSPNPGGGPQWRPYHYQPIKENGERYETPIASPALVLETYDPTGHIPPQNDRQLGILIEFRFEDYVRSLGYNNWNVARTLPSNSLVDKMARERLLAHIFEHKSDLPTAYKELDIKSGTPKWNSVTITSYLLISLYHSNN